MASTPAFQNETERRFASYLDSRQLAWTYEAQVGRAHPDFSVHLDGGPVICEAHEPVFRLPNRVGASDPYLAIRRSIKKKGRQGVGAKVGGLPYVVVVSDVGSDIVFDASNVPAAMFGDLTVTMQVALGPEPLEEPAEPRLVAGRNSQLQDSKNTRFSAVFVVREFNPTTMAVERTLPAIDGPAVLREEQVVSRMTARFAAFEQAEADGICDPEASAVRLLVFHNPYAAVALPSDLFAGPHDQIYGVVDDDGGYGLAAEGTQSLEVPGRPDRPVR